jgi:transglutaminase-like putative cysteine protease
VRFLTLHKLSTYLMAAAALAAALLGPGVARAGHALALLGVVASWWAEAPRYRAERWAAIWNLGTLLVLCVLAVRVLQGDSIVDAGVTFLLVLLVNKLFNRRSSSDYQQTTIIAFLLLIVATALNTELSYALCFVAFTVAATWSLVLLQLRRELEQQAQAAAAGGGATAPAPPAGPAAPEPTALATRQLIGLRFLAGTSLLSLGMLAGALAVFVSFPRIGFGLFSGAQRRGALVAGFSEQVQLGQHGAIRDNPQVVLRVVLDPRRVEALRATGRLRWRGSVYDRYEGGAWSHSPELSGRTDDLVAVDGLYWANPAPGLPQRPTTRWLREHLLRQEIYLEPIGSSLLFGLDRPVALELIDPPLLSRRLFVPQRGPLGELRAGRPRSAGLRYVVYSQLYTPDPALARQALIPPGDRRLARYLRLPPSLPPRVIALARRVTAGRVSAYDKALALQRHLQRAYRYTTALAAPPAGAEALDSFLFERRAGHCEYFATALAILLRAVDVPTRHVNGLLGGQWNGYGRYLAVRQSDAHAWTEVLLPGLGWVAFDATPAGGEPPTLAGGWLLPLQELVDTLRLRWLRYVIEYDLSKQRTLFVAAGRLLRGRSPTPGPGAALPSGRRRPLLLLLIVAIGAGAAWLLLRRPGGGGRALPRAASARTRAHPATRVYARALRALARAGIPRPTDTTPVELAARLARAGHPAAALVEELTRCYYAARFGRSGLSAAQAQQLETLLGRLRRSLRAARGGSS